MDNLPEWLVNWASLNAAYVIDDGPYYRVEKLKRPRACVVLFKSMTMEEFIAWRERTDAQ